MFRSITILFITCLCTACSTVVMPASPFGVPSSTPTTAIRPEATSTVAQTAVPVAPSTHPTEQPTPTPRTLDYKLTYQDGDFAIREAFLGKSAIWQWENFTMPWARIQNTAQSLGLGRDMICDKQSKPNTPCSQTLELTLANGAMDKYDFRLENLNGGNGLLIKNGKLIWAGYTNGANSFAILSSKRIGDEIVFDYSKSNWGSKAQDLWISYSILITKGKTVVLIPDAFGPNAVAGKLIYFRMKHKKEILVFDGKEVGEEYDEVFNLLCCWHGPPIEIASNGKMIDFFAQKEDGWYHVQAGYLADNQ